MIVYPASTELPAIDQPKSYLVRRRLAGVEASRSGRGFPDCGCGRWLPRRPPSRPGPRPDAGEFRGWNV